MRNPEATEKVVEHAMIDRLHDVVEECADCSGDIALTDVAGHYSGVCAKCRRAYEGAN